MGRFSFAVSCTLLVFLAACGTLEVGIVPPTDTVRTVPVQTLTSPSVSPPLQTEVIVTPTPSVDHWTVTPFRVFGIVLERPLDWEVDAEYGDPERGDTRYAGVDGFVHVDAMGAPSLDEAAAAEVEHHLRPYGPQPIIESLQVGGQEARLIIPSGDLSAEPSRQAAIIVRYPQPVEIGGQQYPFLIIWADREYIRTIAQTVQFDSEPSPEGTTRPTVPITWEMLPPGLVFGNGSGLNLVDAEEQPVLLHNDPQAVLSPDGSRLLTYDVVQQDIWMLERAEGAIWRLTDTPQRQECCMRWWRGRPDVVLFQSTPEGVNGMPFGAPGYLTAVGADGQGYHVLDPEHAFGLYQFAPSPDGQVIAYSDGVTAWFYRWGGAEVFDPADYGLTVRGGVQVNQPAWSPDGRRLAWIVKGPLAVDGGLRAGVALFDLEAHTAQVLHPYEPPGEGWPSVSAWSPDGVWLAFTDSSASDRAGLWIARGQGEAVEERHLGLGGNPVWSPDGRWLAFQSVTEAGVVVYMALDVETWERRTLNLPVGRYGQLVDWIPLDSSAVE